MTKLRTLLAAALITLPVLATDAAVPTPDKPQISQSQPPATCCWVMILGRWWCIPC
jgi:hypothetical protein